jgi:hypothetical protein
MRSPQFARWHCLVAMVGVLALSSTAWSQQIPPNSHLLELPWMVIDRATNQDCARLGPAQAEIRGEARKLASAGQAALDTVLRDHRMFTMISRSEWEPYWHLLKPGTVVWQGTGCAVCGPAAQLLRYDRAALQQLGREVGAEYVWLGVIVVPMTSEEQDNRHEECCEATLGHARQEVLARSSALLIRVSDGKVIWQGDVRRLTSDARVGTPPRNDSLAMRREMAVKDTAQALGAAFVREHRQSILAQER